MNLSLSFYLINAGLGVGLAMDAFSVSLANGLNEPKMKVPKAAGVAGIFGFFQGFMPLLGWLCISTVAQQFEAFQKIIPWIALILLCIIGGKMLIEGIKNKDSGNEEKPAIGITGLLVQGIATSIDALSVGFTFADENYNFSESLIASIIIGLLTFIICFAGIFIGKKVGTKLAGKAGIFGGSILIIIGLEIFITGFFG